ncbi:MAG TPA: AtpZ/AtpI family protein [Caulobacteraceae bacterium]|nr:AtpZ/AtpI family protein [Caulobacteraceae bacterium]
MTGPLAQPPQDGDRGFADRVGRRASLRAFWLAHGERSIARNLAMIGALGWLVVTPTIVGVFLGRWLDRRWSGGIFWTGGLIVAGLTLGCWLAWRRIREIEREDDA